MFLWGPCDLASSGCFGFHQCDEGKEPFAFFLFFLMIRTPREETGKPGQFSVQSLPHAMLRDTCLEPTAWAAPRLCHLLRAHPSPRIKLSHEMSLQRLCRCHFPGPYPCPGGVTVGEAEGYLCSCKAGKEISGNTSLLAGIYCGDLPFSFMCK